MTYKDLKKSKKNASVLTLTPNVKHIKSRSFDRIRIKSNSVDFTLLTQQDLSGYKNLFIDPFLDEKFNKNCIETLRNVCRKNCFNSVCLDIPDYFNAGYKKVIETDFENTAQSLFGKGYVENPELPPIPKKQKLQFFNLFLACKDLILENPQTTFFFRSRYPRFSFQLLASNNLLKITQVGTIESCLLYTSPSPRD